MYAKILAPFTLYATTPEDQAWGNFHVGMIHAGINVPSRRAEMAAAYRAFADEQPALATLALKAAAHCDHDAILDEFKDLPF